MKLISDFKDYYDGCLSLDTDDQELLFKRLSTNVNNIEDKFHYLFGRRSTQVTWEKQLYNIKEHIIGFCGNFYKGIILTPQESPYTNNNIKNITLYPSVIQEDLHSLYNIYECTHNRYYHKNMKQDISEYLNDNLNYQYIFNQFKVPAFCIKPNKWNKCDLLLAPKLEDYRFPRVFNSFMAFQEIRMFLENMKKDEPDVNIPTGDDIVLAESKGFDNFSFRTPKGKSKRINKKNKCN